MRRCWLWLLALLVWSPIAVGDWQTRSWSRWEVSGTRVEAVFGIEAIELGRLGLPSDPAWLSREIGAAVELSADGAACQLDRTVPVPAERTRIVLRLGFSCPHAPDHVALRWRLLLDAASNPMHYAVFRWRDRQQVEALFTRAAQEHGFSAAPATDRPSWQVLADYLALGFDHILAGADHIAFLLCMLLVSPRLGHRLWMITGFTLGHSLTLSLAATGLISTHTAAVEALIGFTVALLAAESLGQAQQSRLPALVLCVVVLGCVIASVAGGLSGIPPVTLAAVLVLTPAYLLLASRVANVVRLHIGMTAVFGLVHGLGFAGVLQALGLPPGRRPWALAGFNIGVEIGQLVLLAGFAVLLHTASRLSVLARDAWLERALAIALCAIGVFWFVGRSAV